MIFSSDSMADGYGQGGDRVLPIYATHLKNYSEFFIDFVLQHQQFLHANPLHLVCAIIAFSRRSINLAKDWTWELKALTGVSLRDFQPLLEELVKKYRIEFPSEEKSPEQ